MWAMVRAISASRPGLRQALQVTRMPSRARLVSQAIPVRRNQPSKWAPCSSLWREEESRSPLDACSALGGRGGVDAEVVGADVHALN